MYFLNETDWWRKVIKTVRFDENPEMTKIVIDIVIKNDRDWFSFGVKKTQRSHEIRPARVIHAFEKITQCPSPLKKIMSLILEKNS